MPPGFDVRSITTLNCDTLFSAANYLLYRSFDAGLNWRRDEAVRHVTNVVAGINGQVIAGGSGFYYLTENTGANWERNHLSCFFPTRFTINNNGDIFSGGCDQKLTCQANQGVYRLLSEEEHWNFLGDLNGIPSIVKISKQGHLYVTISPYHIFPNFIYRSLDNGNSWQDISHGVSGLYLRDIEFNSRGETYGSSTSAIYRFDPDSLSWVEIAIGPSGMRQIVFNAHDILFAATSSGRIYRSLEPVVGIPLAARRDLPMDFELFPVYPNPFNSKTMIEFHLAETEVVTIRLFNISGQLVRELSQKQYPSGRQMLSWDATDDAGNPVSSGTYFIHLQTPQFNQTRKIILAR